MYIEARDIQLIAEVLEELEDWEALAGWLNIRRSAVNNINRNCASFQRAQCQWRELVKTYCDMNTDDDPYKTVADIADLLDNKMGKKRHAQRLKQLVLTSEFMTTT